MPKLRRLSGAQVVRALAQHGFEVNRIRGSHHILRRIVEGQTQTINVPVHASQILPPGLLKRLFRDVQRYFSEDDARAIFYTE